MKEKLHQELKNGLEIASKPPWLNDGFKEPLKVPPLEKISAPSISFWKDVRRRFFQSPLAIIGLSILSMLIVMSLFGPWISGYTYYETYLEFNNLPPNSAYWFGSDDLGRDLFTRIWYGARISLFIGISAALIDLTIGVFWGGCAALLGGRFDNLMMRIADILYSIPYLLVVIMLMVVMGGGVKTILVAMTITGWIGMARIVRGQVLHLRKSEFVLAATALGASQWRILFRHLLPNAMGPIIVMMTMTIPIAIFTEAFLSFLGLGVQAPIASWGTMAAEGVSAMRYYPWRLFFPAAFICATMLAFYLVGDSLRDALDPRLR
ncbi:MAG: ABC transporter permease [Verrucomicrobia bacterium]|nr:ABC transporter permease [Verrucomicrobiota bacterium]